MTNELYHYTAYSKYQVGKILIKCQCILSTKIDVLEHVTANNIVQIFCIFCFSEVAIISKSQN